MSAPAVPPPRVAARAAVAGAAALACVVAVGLARRTPRPTPAPPTPEPAADFVVAAGDSTYWVTRAAGPRGVVRVRASALFLARWGGHLSEVYVTDDDRAFDDGAWFSAQRVYRRDLLTGDSALVFADPAVPRLAAHYAAAHPTVRALDPDEPTPTPDPEADEEHDPPASAETDVAISAAHGPYVSLEQRTAGVADDGSDALLRRVVDLRTGREASLAALFGPAVAARVAAAGDDAFRTAVAAIRPAARAAVRAAAAGAQPQDAEVVADPDRELPRRALDALGTLRFDPRSFGLTDLAGEPAVTFVALGRDREGLAVTLPLAPLRVPGPAPAWWRDEVAPALLVGAPAGGAGRGARWRPTRGGYEVRARVTAGTTALELVARPGGAPAPGTAVPGPTRSWPLVRVPAGPTQLFPLDDRATRRALRRAFDESAFYDEAVTSVAWRPRRPIGARRAGLTARPAVPAPAPRSAPLSAS